MNSEKWAQVIVDWIVACRKKAGLTQTELGEKLGVTKQNVSHWETKRHEPSYTQMLKIAEAAKNEIPLPGLPDPWLPFGFNQKRFSSLPPEGKADIIRTVNRLLLQIENESHKDNDFKQDTIQSLRESMRPSQPKAQSLDGAKKDDKPAARRIRHREP